MRSISVVILALVIAACGDSSGPTVASVTITPGQDSLRALGITRQLTAVARGAAGDTIRNRPVTWNSSAPGVASVDANGLVTTHTNGNATITATIDGVPGTAAITVAQRAATVNITQAAVTITGIEKAAGLTAVALDSHDSTIAGASFTWSAVDTAIAAVSSSGAVTSRGVGVTKVAATRDGASDTVTVTVNAHYYVHAAAGSDGNAGTSAAPFKTITHALSVAADSHTIKVMPGRYDEANGEVFPFTGPPGVILIGDEANKGGGATATLIAHTDSLSATRIFHLPNYATVAGFSIADSSADDYSFVAATGNVLRNNRWIGRGVNFALYIFSTGIIRGNVISHYDAGLYFSAAGDSIRVEQNVITLNKVGVAYPGTNGDLGGGAAGSLGGNIISCNTIADVQINTAFTLSAINNQWDHVPPTQSDTYAGGTDLYLQAGGAGGAITTTGASLAPSPCP